MSHFRFPRTFLAGALTALAVIGAAPPARAQDNVVAGRVMVAGTNEPIRAAQITVTGGTQGAVSDDEGRFRITGLSGTTATLNVRRIGYRTQTVSARVGQTDLVVSLVSNPTSLEATVVTGTSGAQAKREIGNSVGTIDASSIVATAPILSMQGLLNGRTPSLVVMPTSGQVGTGSQIRVTSSVTI
jgi:iron complex outermembrane receptor protein